MKSFRIEDKNFYQAILPVLEQCFELETDILYKFGGETFTKIVEDYLSPDSDVSMGMITKWGHSTEFFFTKTKENYYVDFVNLHPEDVDEISRI